FDAVTPPVTTGVSAISAGYFQSLELLNNGTVTGRGCPPVILSLPCMTPPAGLSNVKAISACTLFDLALKSDGTVGAWGDKHNGQLNVPPSANGALAISAGQSHG